MLQVSFSSLKPWSTDSGLIQESEIQEPNIGAQIFNYECYFQGSLL